jgi:teichuronic acid biosynthesis protein TuaE
MHRNNFIINLILIIAGMFSFFPVLNENIKYFSYFFLIMTFVVFTSYSIITHKKFYFYKKDIKIYVFLLLWLAYAIFSSIWTYNIKLGLVESFRIASSFITFFLVAQSISNKEILEKTYYFFIIVFVLYIGIAIWEITTFNHLPTSKHGIEGISSFIPFGPFFNRNDMAAALLMLMPFVLFQINSSQSNILKVLLSLQIILMGVSITLAGARIGMIFYVFVILIYMFYYTSLKVKISSIAMIFLLVLSLKIISPLQYEFFKLYLVQQVSSLGDEQERYIEGSISIRKSLIKENIDMMYESKFLGVGSGNIPSIIAQKRFYNTQNILNPHNFLLELTTAYGLIFGLIFVYFYIHLLFDLYKIMKREKDNFHARAAFLSLLLFIPASVLPSSIIKYNFYWIFFAYFTQFINLNQQHDESENIRVE